MRGDSRRAQKRTDRRAGASRDGKQSRLPERFNKRIDRLIHEIPGEATLPEVDIFVFD